MVIGHGFIEISYSGNVCGHSDIVAAKNQLLKVAERTYQVIADLDADQLTRGDHHFRMCGHLHIVAMCALLCRDKYHPTLEDCRLETVSYTTLSTERKWRC